MGNKNLKIRVIIMMIFIRSLACAISVNAETLSFKENWRKENIVGGWETAISINDETDIVVTYAKLNTQGGVAVKLRELMEGLNYSIEWDGVYRFIRLRNSENSIKIYIDAGYCDINGKRIYLNGSVFIDNDYSFCSLSFLRNIMSIETVYIEKSHWNNRINGIALATSKISLPSRKPFPDTSLFVGGMPLYVDYAENLKESLPYNTSILACDGSNGCDEEIIVYTKAVLKNFKISSVKYNEASKCFTEDSIIFEQEKIVRPMVVEIHTVIPEGIPVEAISFTDSEGITSSYLLRYDGKNGSVALSSVALR